MYLVRASTSSEDTSGEGARTSKGSPRSMSSHRVCTWVSTGRKHLVQDRVMGAVRWLCYKGGKQVESRVNTFNPCLNRPPELMLAWTLPVRGWKAC